jgi:hypothetical protein
LATPAAGLLYLCPLFLACQRQATRVPPILGVRTGGGSSFLGFSFLKITKIGTLLFLRPARAVFIL